MVHCLSVLAALLAADGSEAKPQPRPADIEPAVLKVLRDGKPEALAAVAADIAALSPAARRDLPVRVRGDAVEFRFRGEFPGKDFSPEMLEYVIGPKEKNYEFRAVVHHPLLALYGGEVTLRKTARPE